VFAEQITDYLREARERREVPPPIAPAVRSEVTPPPVQAAKAKKGVMAQLLLAAAAEEKPDEFLEFVVETPVEPPDQAFVSPAPSRREAAEPELIATYRREPATAAESQEDDAPEMQSEWMSGTAAQSPSPVLMPEEPPLALRVIEAPAAPAVNVAVAVSVNIGGAVNMVTPRRSTRPRKAPPVQDEWGFFDPNQCGFLTLIAKLDEIAGLDESDN
jgi:hypothetical protein